LHAPEYGWITVTQQGLLANALTSVASAIFIADRKGQIVWANDAFCLSTGYSSEELLDHSPSILKSGRQATAFYQDLWETILAGQVWQGELVQRRKDGTLFTVEETITPLSYMERNTTHFIANLRAITSRKQERDLEHFLAYHDSLTGLPNRALFLNLLQQSIEYAKQRHKFLGILFVDLDYFKQVNDTFGHRIGDLLLMAVANRLRAAVRTTDTVGRIGGDEFTVIETNLDDPQSARSLARKLESAIGRPYMINRHRIKIGASIGFSIYPKDGDDPETLIEKADSAMYRAKGKARWRGGES
jgi:diguanylate cyclase (GGDEF)-like protein/PAS domain S-box-containing protein